MRKEAMLWEEAGNGGVHCFLCAHHCKITESGFGICGMRQNIKGRLYTYAYGTVISMNVDPIEKKPLYHFLPATTAFSIATIGCNFKCSFCQNWTISQISEKDNKVDGRDMTPDEIVKEAVLNSCRSISYTYTEPTIFFEYAFDTARIAKEKGIKNTFVSNGYMTKEAIDEIAPYLDAVNIDLKFFRDDQYRKICGGTLQPVLDSIRGMKEAGVWVEVTTLIVPGENDSYDELNDIACFIAKTGAEIPWHISRFHPDHKLTDHSPTPRDTMETARDIGKKAGLKHIYIGNVGDGYDTFCPECGVTLIKRGGYTPDIQDNFRKSGECVSCGSHIEGVWS